MTEFNFDTVFDETMQTHNLDTVVILGHLNPDGDAAGSVMSLAHYIHVNYPQYRVFPYLAKTLERGPKKMVVEDKTFVPFEMPDISGKQYCAIVCDNAKENLNSAKNWGLVDMFGGGFFTTMLKHSKMDQAKRNMEQAKYDLRSFSRELNDVNMACNLNINTGDFLSFADYFFDGFVVDWVVQDRINNAKRQVEEAIRRTESIVSQLQRM